MPERKDGRQTTLNKNWDQTQREEIGSPGTHLMDVTVGRKEETTCRGAESPGYFCVVKRKWDAAQGGCR
ncbi:hypothetical protein ANANG_G00084370 [Anguilla anguilla]|uniref:Uncharacterized protein n=1 Tax=Anguilla anguilla TaxID=7936 RepID=A0A9D3S0F9_ANGAN|nr:hypothetical protein ANANG_G00084370 [Anguilla anguilla]